MNKISLRSLIGSILVVLSFLPTSLSQVSPDKGPLSVEKIEVLLKPAGFGPKLQDQATSADIDKRGIDFVVTDEILARLKAAGAGLRTLQALIKIRDSKTITAPFKRSNRLKILVAKFADKSETADKVTDVVISQLREATGGYPNVEIVALNENISAAEGTTIAYQKAKSQQADIIIWGWYKTSKSSVVINSQIQVVSSFENSLLNGHDVIKPREKTEVQEIPNFENFTSQLRLSKELAFVTVVCLGLLNLELGDFDESLKLFSDVISMGSSFSKLVDLSKVYILRGLSRLSSSDCNGAFDSRAVLSDIDNAISLGASPTGNGILMLKANVNLKSSPKAAMDSADKLLKSADNDDAKSQGLFFMMMASAYDDDEKKTKEYAGKLNEHLLPLSESFMNDLFLTSASLILEDNVKAARYLDKTLKTAGSNIFLKRSAYTLESRMYFFSGNFDRAIESLKNSLSLKPCADTYVLLGDAYDAKENPDSAITAYNQSLEIDPNNSGVYVKLGTIYETKEDFKLAEAYYAKAIDRDATSIEAYMAQANLSVKNNNTNGAISAYSKILSIDKANDAILLIRADLYMKSDQYELALSDYKRWFPLVAKSTDKLEVDQVKLTFLLLQREFLTRSDFSHGIEFAELYMSLYPLDGMGFYFDATNLEATGKLDLAIQQISKAIALNPNDVGYYVKRAAIWKTKGDYKSALDDMAQAIRMKSDDPDNYYQRSTIYEQMHNFEYAINDLEKAIQISKDPTKIKFYRSYITILKVPRN